MQPPRKPEGAGRSRPGWGTGAVREAGPPERTWTLCASGHCALRSRPAVPEARPFMLPRGSS